MCITNSMETAFFRWGVVVSHRPRLSILLSLLLCTALSIGNIFYRMETDDEVLWTPYGSPFIEQNQWIRRNFPKDRRFESLIAESENIISADNIKYLWSLQRSIQNLVSTNNDTYLDLCCRTPSPGGGEATVKDCISLGLFALGRFTTITDEEVAQLTDESINDILTDIVQAESSGVGSISELISGLRTEQGRVVGARALLLVWVLTNSAPERALAWETELVELLVHSPPPGKPEGLELFTLAERSYDDEIDYVVNSNISILLSGFALLFVYVAVVLGNFNRVEQRVMVSFAGILVIGMATGSAFGLCLYCGLSINDMTPIIPFLLLGIGVDDMFVIVQSLDNLGPEGSPEDRISDAMKHAGLAITVTSFTDLAAFFIGSTTSMPILRSFCIFAGTGVFFLYIYAITFFVGCLVLDERRRMHAYEKRVEYNPPAWTRVNIANKVFSRLTTVLFHPVVSGLVVLLTLGMAAIGVYGLCYIESDYDSIWYMRQDSYQAKYYKRLAEDFRGQGERVEIYLGGLDYVAESEQLLKIPSLLEQNKFVRTGSTTFWFQHFMENHNTTNFLPSLGRFLLEERPDDLENIKLNISSQDPSFVQDLLQGRFSIKASRIKFQHVALDNTTIRNEAMDQVKADMATIVFTTTEFRSPIVYSYFYIQWEANKVISQEPVRNVSLAFGVIATVSVLLITELAVALLVIACVALTLLDMVGVMYFIGLTVEIVTSINLLLSVGLALDYSAHIGVTYLVSQGSTGKERSRKVLVEMGPAVFNGGFSTFLAFFLVAFSDSYVFQTFFKMFGMVVGFGLFHGLLVLPVLLAWVGARNLA